MSSEPNTEDSRTKPAPDRDAQNARVRVLVVEDTAVVRRVIVRGLGRGGFDVVEADCGHAGIEMAKRQDIDLAIVDLGLPDMSGVSAIARLKAARGVTLPVIAMSGDANVENRVRAFDAGADDFLSKPLHMPELLCRVEAFRRTQSAYLAAQVAREAAEHIHVYASEAVALLAHDINNGLAAGLCNLQYLEEVLDLTGDSHDALTATTRSVFRLCGLVANFVDISRMEDTELTPTMEDANVHALLARAAEIHRPGTVSKKAAIHVRAPATLAARMDAALIERVIHNILGNATRYVNAGGEIVLSARADGEKLRIEIANTGASVPAEMRSTLFEKYRVSGSEGKRGMGLYFSRLACEAHGGSIFIEEDDDYGTKFVLLLPGVQAASS